MVNGNCFKFDDSYHAVMVLPVLEANLVLLIESVSFVGVGSCQKLGFPSCACFLAQLSPDLYTKNDQERLHKNYNFETAASYHGQKVVLSREFAEHKNEAARRHQFSKAFQLSVL